LWKLDLVLKLARPDPAVVRECLRYSRIRMSGAFFVLAMFAVSSFFRGIGDVRTPMIAAIVANVTNVVFDALLIFGLGPFPRLTAFGAGLATAIANVVGFSWILTAFLRGSVDVYYASRHERPFRPPEMLRLLRVGLPMGAQFFLDMSSFTVFMAIVGRLGTDELAASQIGVQILSFSFMPASGISKAATTLVGQYIGASRKHLAERCGWTVLRMNLVYSLAVAAGFLLGGRSLISVFNSDPGVIAAGGSIIPMLALFQILDAGQMSYSGALQGAGDTTFTMIAYAASAWFIFVPASYLLAGKAGLGIVGAWAGGLIHLCVLDSVLTWRFARGAWKKISV